MKGNNMSEKNLIESSTEVLSEASYRDAISIIRQIEKDIGKVNDLVRAYNSQTSGKVIKAVQKLNLSVVAFEDLDDAGAKLEEVSELMENAIYELKNPDISDT
jgi:alcohol dehydrogenase class IV